MNKGKLVIYKDKRGETKLDVKLEKETVWLTQKQMAVLFDKDIRTVNEHIQNIYQEDELNKWKAQGKFSEMLTITVLMSSSLSVIE
jgi:hypothetical protein